MINYHLTMFLIGLSLIMIAIIVWNMIEVFSYRRKSKYLKSIYSKKKDNYVDKWIKK